MKRIFWMASLCHFAVAFLIAGGGVLYQQSPIYVAPGGTTGWSWTSTLAGGVGGFRTFDSFRLSVPATVGSVRWFALAWDYFTPANNPVAPITTSWDIAFYADSGGAPGSQLYDSVQAATSVTTTFLGTAVFGTDTVNVYQFDANLPGGFRANAGPLYWFSPLALQSAFDPLMSWIEGIGGDIGSLQLALDAGGAGVPPYSSRVGDRAFTLFAAGMDAPYQVRYAANYSSNVDSEIKIINDGGNGNVNQLGPSFGGINGNICVNVYVFDPKEELLACCSCMVTPNQAVPLSVKAIMANLLTPEKPTSVTIKLVGSNGGSTGFATTSCQGEAAQVVAAGAHGLAGGYVAFGTTAHVAANGLQVVETPFIPATLSASELKSITTRCSTILGNGSSYGQCNGCTNNGVAGAAKK